METYPKPEQAKSLPQGGEIQDGDTRNHQVITPTRGMGHIHRLSGRLFPYSNTGTIQEIFEISRPRANIPVQGPAVWTVHSTLGVYCGRKGGETDAHTQGYKNPPVPRRLVGEIQIPQNLSPTYPNPDQNVPGPRLAGEFRKIRAGTQTDLRLCRLPVRPQVRPGQTDPGPVAKPSGQDTTTPVVTGLSGPTVHVPGNSLTAEQKLQLATPTYKARKEKELQKKASSPSLVDPSSVTVVGKVESGKGDSGDRGETPKKKKTPHKSPKKTSKPPKVPDFQSDLKNMDEKWSERFTRLEALFLSKTFQLPVEPVQSSSVVVSEKPFVPPVEHSTHQSPTTGVTGKKKKSATQPVEAPGAKKLATQPVEAPGAGVDLQLTDQAAFSSAGASTSGRPEVQPPGPTTLINRKKLLQKRISSVISQNLV